MQKIKLPPWPHFEEDEIHAVKKVLASGKVNYWTGNECKLFEKEFAEYVGCQYAISLANGTNALELALHALDIVIGDEVIVPCRTFIATASAVIKHGAIPIVADIDSVSQNITAETIKAVLTKKTKAIIIVHLAGWPCDMDPIIELAKKNNLKVIEDCAQAHGAHYKGRHAGSIGAVGTFSFCQDKIMTTGGEGGMLVTSDKSAWEKAWRYKDHGKDYYLVHDNKPSVGFRWLHREFGTNFRMTEMQAAIGRIQLRKLPEWVEIRRRNAKFLNDSFQSISAFRLTIPKEDYYHAYYKYYVFIDPDKLRQKWTRDRVMVVLNDYGVSCYTGSCSEIYREQSFTGMNIQPKERFVVAKALAETSLMFLVHPTLTESNVAEMSKIICGVIRKASV